MQCGNFILFLQLASALLYGQAVVPEREMKDEGVRTVIEKYVGELREKGFASHRKYHIAIRVDPVQNPTLVFIQGISSLSFFVHEIPKYYFKYQERLIFVFPGAVEGGSDSVLFSRFYDQFEKYLEHDLSRNRTRNVDSSQWIDDITCWRVTLSKGKIQSFVFSTFPTYHISLSHKYDDEGNLIYRDGIRDGTGMGRYGARVPKNLSIKSYISNHTDVPLDSLSGIFGPRALRRTVGAIVVIDEKGRVVEAKVTGIKDDQTRYKVEGALLSMPRWQPATRYGKPIKVRVRLTI